MDAPILAPRGASGFVAATDIANFTLGITYGDARPFIAGRPHPSSIPCKAARRMNWTS
jgi:hypothetical protein